MTGKIVVQDCPCEKRFKNNATRLAKLSGAVKNTIETASIKQEGDEDSDSSTSEEDETVPTKDAGPKKVPQPDIEKVNPDEKTKKQPLSDTAPGTPSKSAPKSGKPLKSSKPSTIDCDKDLKVTSQDDTGITGTFVAHSCHGTRFNRKSARVDNVATKLNSLLKDKCSKAGVKDNLNLKIPKVSGDKAKAEFTFHLPCEKSKQKTVLDQLKASCKDKQFIDTVTNENQPEDDDSSSGSEEEP
ncbi:unnamed protein product, partial [Rotaria sordida]